MRHRGADRQEGETVNTLRYSKTAAPRSAVVHMVNAGPTRNYSHETACGRRIGDEWAGEYTEEPTGDVTCKRCLPYVAEIDADAAVSTGGMPLDDECPTGTAEEVARVSRQISEALSPRSWEERGEDESRARSMAAHPAGKGLVHGAAYRAGMPAVPEADGNLYQDAPVHVQRWTDSIGRVYTWGICDIDNDETAVTRISLGESGTAFLCNSHTHRA